MFERAFNFMDVPIRSQKTRTAGLTMMVDYYLPLEAQRDLLQAHHHIVDLAKVFTGTAGVMPRSLLEAKVAAYKEFDAMPFIGGQFLEYGIVRHGLGIARQYFKEAASLGFMAIEVSDNNLSISKEDKQGLIRMAVEEFGLKVLGEVGTKEDVSSPLDLAQGVKDCVAAGSWKVFVEAAEFMSKEDGSVLPQVVRTISENADIKDMIFELPGSWIKGVNPSDIYETMIFLVDEFGMDANVANVSPESLMHLETLRLGVGVKLKQ